MALNIYRVVVRGEFSDLTPDARERLVADAEAHDITLSSYTATGTFTYEPRLHAFSYRFEVRVSADDDVPEPESADEAAQRAETLATADLDARGVTFKRLRVNVVNMADMWRRSG
jgi:hypothetical protein